MPDNSPNRQRARMRRSPRQLSEVRRGSDRFACELRYAGDSGIDARVYKNGSLVVTDRLDTPTLAWQWARAVLRLLQSCSEA